MSYLKTFPLRHLPVPLFVESITPLTKPSMASEEVAFRNPQEWQYLHVLSISVASLAVPRYNIGGFIIRMEFGAYYRDPKKHRSISILWGYPYLTGLHYKGGCMGYPIPNFCLCAFLGPYITVSLYRERIPKTLFRPLH